MKSTSTMALMKTMLKKLTIKLTMKKRRRTLSVLVVARWSLRTARMMSPQFRLMESLLLATAASKQQRATKGLMNNSYL